jgi:hypothetical protein
MSAVSTVQASADHCFSVQVPSTGGHNTATTSATQCNLSQQQAKDFKQGC